MGKEQDIEKNQIYIISNKIVYFVGSNLCFLLTILPLVVYFIGSGSNISLAITLFLSLLLGPAITTLFSTMNKYIKNKHTKFFRDYFHFYKINFAQGIFAAAIFNILITISYYDIMYYSNSNIKYIFLILLIIVILLSFYVYPIISRVNIKTLDAFKAGINVMFGKIYLLFTNIAIIVIGGFLINLSKLSLVAFLVGASLGCWLILILEREVLEKIEEEVVAKYEC